MKTTNNTTLLAFPLALALAACGSSDDGGGGSSNSTAEGRVTDNRGTTSGLSLAGSGTVEAASYVEAHQMNDDGTSTVFATADVSAEGTYQLEVPANEHKVVIWAYDESEARVGGAILDVTGAADSTTQVEPVTSESSLEAMVFAEMVAKQGVAESNSADLRTRVDESMAAEVMAKAESSGDASAEVSAIAEAAIAAQTTEIESYQEAGIETSQEALFEAEAGAAAAFAQSLDAAASAQARADAYETFLVGLQSAAMAKGASAQDCANAEGGASASFRAVAEARFSGAESAELLDAMIAQAGAFEARARADAIEASMILAGASTNVQEAAVEAGAELYAAASAAASAEAVVQAYGEFEAELTGTAESDISSSFLGAYLGVDLTTEAAVSAAVEASASAAAALDASLASAATSAMSQGAAINFELLAEQTVAAYATFYGEVHSSTDGLVELFGSAEAEATASILINAHGSFSGAAQ